MSNRPPVIANTAYYCLLTPRYDVDCPVGGPYARRVAVAGYQARRWVRHRVAPHTAPGSARRSRMAAWTVPSYAEWAVPGYTEERLLGHGVSGRVVAAVNDATGQRVAIKYLHENLVRDAEFLGELRSEAERLVSLNAPHMVRVFDYVEQPGEGAAIVMELIDGVSLREMLT